MVHSSFAKLSQVKLHYLGDDVGGGEAVVLPHGWPHTSRTWRHVIPKPSKTLSGRRAGRGRANEAQDSISRLVTNLDAHIIPDCGHLVPEEAPDELGELLLSFLGN